MDALAIIATTYIEGRTEPSGHIHARAIVTALHAAGYTIVHRDENHGPTLERAAERGDQIAKRDFSASYRCGASDTSAAIRAMEVKNDA